MKQLYFRSSITETNPESRTICGYAVVFNRWSQDLGGFIERVLPTAITQELLDNSDVIANYEHDSDNNMLARWKNGEGTLKLELREEGLWFEFEAPETRLGEYILDHIRSGNIDECSFCFSLADDGDVWYRNDNNQVCRDITNIGGLYDVSVVKVGAYSDTYCFARNLEEQEANSEFMEKFLEEEKRTINETETVEVKEEETRAEEEKEDEEVVEEITEEEEKETNTEKEEETVQEENPADEAENNEESVEETDKENKEEKKDNKRKMEKNFSLLKTIRSIVENKSLDEVSEAVINAGREEMRKSGLNCAGQIQIPSETRAIVTVTAEGEDVVATDLYDIMTPLRAKNVLAQAGAKFLTNLTGDVQIPLMSEGNVTWEGEVASAKDAGYTFDSVKLSPRRLTAFVDISKTFLVQDGLGAEAMIRQDLINAINSKLEATILGDEAGTATKPEGIFYTTGTTATIADYGDIADLEADVEDANVMGDCKYIMSNKAKAGLRTMIKGTNGTGMVLEGNEVDGTQVYNTSNVGGKKVVYGDFSNLAIAQFGNGVDIVVDPYSKAADNQVRLVVNAYFDAKILRPEAFAIGEVA